MAKEIDFSLLRQKRLPTKAEASLYRRWVKYLSNSRLTSDEIHKRAEALTKQGQFPKD